MTQTFTTALRALLPPPEAEERDYLPAFRQVADLLLNRSTLYIAGQPHRFTEVEFYFNGHRHPDRFTHGDPLQKQFGRWYFHRFGGEYRAGTYKGLDLAFGNPEAFGGVLVRGVERLADRHLLDGPCMFVDHILSLTGTGSIAELVSRFDLSLDAPASGLSPLYVAPDASRQQPVLESPRVGLTLKKGADDIRQRFIARPYRFLTEPTLIKKGKLHLALALHAQGRPVAEISQLTSTREAVIKNYVASFEAGKARSPAEFRAELNTDDTCQLFGACQKLL